MTPGLKPSMRPSADRTRSRTRARSASDLRSRLRISERLRRKISFSGGIGGRLPGRSIRITSAPWSASIIAANGAGARPANSTILTPASTFTTYPFLPSRAGRRTAPPFRHRPPPEGNVDGGDGEQTGRIEQWKRRDLRGDEERDLGADESDAVAPRVGELLDDLSIGLARSFGEETEAELVEDDVVDDPAVGFVGNFPVQAAPAERPWIDRPGHRPVRAE